MSWNAGELRSSRSASSSAGKRSAGTTSGAPQRKKRKKKKNTLRNTVIYILCVVLVSTLLAEVGWLLANDLCAFNKEYKEVTVEVVRSDSVGDVADKLKEGGLIEYRWLFNLFAAFMKAETKIGVGEYTLNTNMDYKSLINHMRNKNASLSADTVKVSIPEGYTVAELIKRLADYGVSTEEKLTETAKNHVFEYTFVDNENLGSLSRLEGYLFPDTYEFYVNDDPVRVFNKLLGNFQTHVDSEVLAQIEQTGKSLKEIIIMASLIEKETDGKDQRKIASVIYNRINNPAYETGGLLQIDASALYSDDPAYDLYINKGLPPTAIANPGMDSINAAINPANTEYYYYALGKDGVHHYFTNYRDHVNFINSSAYQSNGY